MKEKISLSLVRDGRKIKLVYVCLGILVSMAGFTFWNFNPMNQDLNERIKLALIDNTFIGVTSLVGLYITGNVLQGVFTRPEVSSKPSKPSSDEVKEEEA